jgi:hypothetical protein
MGPGTDSIFWPAAWVAEPFEAATNPFYWRGSRAALGEHEREPLVFSPPGPDQSRCKRLTNAGLIGLEQTAHDNHGAALSSVGDG